MIDSEEGDLDRFTDKFFGKDLSTICRAIIDVVVVGIDGAAPNDVGIGKLRRLIFLASRFM